MVSLGVFYVACFSDVQMNVDSHPNIRTFLLSYEYFCWFSHSFRLFKSGLLEFLVPWETETLVVKENVIISRLIMSSKNDF